LLATVIYFQQEGYQREEIYEKVKIVKSDKNYTDDEIAFSFDFLKEICADSSNNGVEDL
jgi:hypothetical protein